MEDWKITEPITSSVIDLQNINNVNKNHVLNDRGEKLVVNLLGVTSRDWCTEAAACDDKRKMSIGRVDRAKFYMEGNAASLLHFERFQTLSLFVTASVLEAVYETETKCDLSERDTVTTVIDFKCPRDHNSTLEVNAAFPSPA